MGPLDAVPVIEWGIDDELAGVIAEGRAAASGRSVAVERADLDVEREAGRAAMERVPAATRCQIIDGEATELAGASLRA